MLIKQISVFVENVPGQLSEVSKILGENGIDMSALSLADTTEFGILRLIVNDPEKACDVLRAQNYIVKQNYVVAAVVDDRPGGLTGVLDILSAANVAVEYMYAFVGSKDGHAVVVIRPDNAEGRKPCLHPGPQGYLSPVTFDTKSFFIQHPLYAPVSQPLLLFLLTGAESTPDHWLGVDFFLPKRKAGRFGKPKRPVV